MKDLFTVNDIENINLGIQLSPIDSGNFKDIITSIPISEFKTVKVEEVNINDLLSNTPYLIFNGKGFQITVTMNGIKLSLLGEDFLEDEEIDKSEILSKDNLIDINTDFNVIISSLLTKLNIKLEDTSLVFNMSLSNENKSEIDFIHIINRNIIQSLDNFLELHIPAIGIEVVEELLGSKWKSNYNFYAIREQEEGMLCFIVASSAYKGIINIPQFIDIMIENSNRIISKLLGENYE
ncbi:MAG: hypothetical protein KatS3mg003_1840 [Candidatus Nitrosocaldaceae archaeon]|nr:MAG: hypothetical protein KatS3mg003_1840 [Candidatus Nitrosocaldaceae archaeon]